MAELPQNDPSRHAKLKELARAFAAALLMGDAAAAELTVRDAQAAGLSAAEIDDDIVAPALWLVGDLWERGEITVADEHRATEISLRVLALQREAQRAIAGRAERRVLLAAPSGELHTVALRMAANLLLGAGYDTRFAGADVPAPALAAAACRHGADVVCLSVTMPGRGDQVLLAVDEILHRRPATAFVLGGRALTSRVRGLPGIDMYERVSDIVAAVDAMFQHPDRN
jgi:MerR family transcriptional regulator, light-induced transcriptional regulator